MNAILLFAALAVGGSQIPADSTTTINVGGKLSLTATTTGKPAPTLQWEKDGNPISGATAHAYEVPAVTNGNAGNYSLVATNPLGAAESNVISVAIATPPAGTPPAITLGPSDLQLPKKGDATFTVAATGTPPLKYQWKKGSTNLVGATTTTLTIKRCMPESAGTYTVSVTGPFGSTQDSAKLTITR